MVASTFRGARPRFEKRFVGTHVVQSYLLADGSETYSKQKFDKDKFYWELLEFAYETSKENPNFMASANLRAMLERGDEIPNIRICSEKEKVVRKMIKKNVNEQAENFELERLAQEFESDNL
jgi:hypothetical protein